MIVALFAAGSVLLVLSQLVILRTACTLCLGSALISFAVFRLSYRELPAAMARVRRRQAQGCTLWQALHGDAIEATDAKSESAHGGTPATRRG